MTLQERFKDKLSWLQDTANGNISLEKENPPLFHDLCKFYADKGVQFWGIDVEEDYSILVDHLIADHVLG